MQLRMAPGLCNDTQHQASWQTFLLPSPTTKAQRPRKQWAQKRNFQNAKPGQSLPGTNPTAQPLNRNLRWEALSPSSAH